MAVSLCLRACLRFSVLPCPFACLRAVRACGCLPQARDWLPPPLLLPPLVSSLPLLSPSTSSPPSHITILTTDMYEASTKSRLPNAFNANVFIPLSNLMGFCNYFSSWGSILGIVFYP
ncbi:hypothetical protein DFH27DRAFT_384360 [Peziza echinospora]|nr:hypothetical protein DFH27DRAFT_384360 [Peziza echinospora]